MCVCVCVRVSVGVSVCTDEGDEEDYVDDEDPSKSPIRSARF